MDLIIFHASLVYFSTYTSQVPRYRSPNTFVPPFQTCARFGYGTEKNPPPPTKIDLPLGPSGLVQRVRHHRLYSQENARNPITDHLRTSESTAPHRIPSLISPLCKWRGQGWDRDPVDHHCLKSGLEQNRDCEFAEWAGKERRRVDLEQSRFFPLLKPRSAPALLFL